MRQKLSEQNLVECMISQGPNHFYNFLMEACVVVCRANNPTERRRKILLINAVDEVIREQAQSFFGEEA